MDKSDSLLACPFCGGVAITKKNQWLVMWAAYCTNHKCMCTLDYYKTEELARKAWNVRAGAPERGDTDGKAVGSSAWLDAAEAALVILAKAAGSVARTNDVVSRELYQHAGMTLQEVMKRGGAASNEAR